jgi:hypothetical protein
MFEESLRIARRIGYRAMTAYTQLGLALLATRAEEPRLAATLHAAADTIHQQLGSRLQPLESRLRAADITRLRDELGDTAFELAYRAGQAFAEPAPAQQGG